MAAALAVSGCASKPAAMVLQGEGLGATWSVKLAGAAPADLDSVRQGIQGRVDEVARHLSRWEAGSSLNALNAASSGEWQAVPAGLFGPLSYAFSLAEDTGGAFDPTVAPLVDAWGFGTAGRRYSPPSAEAVEAARARVGFGKVSLDASAGRVRKPADVQVDLSSMTHGFAADRVAQYLDEIGVGHYLVDIGSEIRARGESPSGGAWRVAVELPPLETVGARQDGIASPSAEGSLKEARSANAITNTNGNASGSANFNANAGVSARSETGSVAGMRVVALKNAGIATSGNYRYYFDYNGRRYSHRIDPRTGEPVEHALASVTVIDPEGMRADALATALTVLGPEAGFQYAQERNIAALFFIREPDDTLIERMTPRFADYLN